MIQYIYFVKCPNCEDEHFDFFDDAKEFALGCLSKKPVITQTEVCRNDFGECTNHADLGTVWSWEDMMKDMPEDNMTVFSKSETLADDADYFNEFDEYSILDDVPDNYAAPSAKATPVARKAVPADMSIRDLVEAMEENEDTVECVACEELHAKADCTYNENHGWICADCQDTVVECTWCNELYDRSECRYEVDLGYLCSRCEAAIKSRGETLTFKEGSYWDFLGESVTDHFDHHDPKYSDEAAADHMADQMDKAKDARYDAALDTLTEPLPQIRYEFDPVTKRYNSTSDIAETLEEAADYRARLTSCRECGEQTLDEASGLCINCGAYSNGRTLAEEITDLLNEDVTTNRENPNVWWNRSVIFEYEGLEVEIYEENTAVVDYKLERDAADVYDAFVELGCLTDADLDGLPGGAAGLANATDADLDAFMNVHFMDLVHKYEEQLMKYFEQAALEDAEEYYRSNPPEDFEYPEEGPGHGAFDSWGQFWRWKEGSKY